jgi:hypothetical protein
MSSFDYNAPAELFLSKPAKGSRTKYRRFATAAEALRYAVEDLRIPKAFGAWLEVGDERFSSSEIQRLYDADDYPLRKPERASVRNETDGAPFRAKFWISTATPVFHKRAKDRPLPLDLSALCEALRTPTPPWTPSQPRQMICATPDSRRRHGHCGLAAEPGPWKV